MASTDATLPQPTPGAKMMFLIRRRAGTSREELIAHWFANHMPGVIRSQEQAAAAGRPFAWRYIATLFDAGAGHDWDGVAQLWWDRPLPRPQKPFGVTPRDSFQEKAEPYMSWATVEYVIVDGSEHLPVAPLTLNEPFPTTRCGFHKITILVAAQTDSDFEAFFRHWLTVHVANVEAALIRAGGFRYVVSLSLEPHHEPYAGMTELYFHEPDGWSRLRETIEADGMERWIDAAHTRVFPATTEMIGIP
jgi:hypothetical protein